MFIESKWYSWFGIQISVKVSKFTYSLYVFVRDLELIDRLNFSFLFIFRNEELNKMKLTDALNIQTRKENLQKKVEKERIE